MSRSNGIKQVRFHTVGDQLLKLAFFTLALSDGAIAVDGATSYQYIECGTLTGTGPLEARLGEIAVALEGVIADLRPVAIAVEDVFARKNPRSALVLAQARGLVLAVAGIWGLPVYPYAAPAVKKAVKRILASADAALQD